MEGGPAQGVPNQQPHHQHEPGNFKDVRFYPTMNFGHFMALPRPRPSTMSITMVNRFLGSGGETTEKKDKKEQNNIVRVLPHPKCSSFLGPTPLFSAVRSIFWPSTENFGLFWAALFLGDVRLYPMLNFVQFGLPGHPFDLPKCHTPL